MALRIKKTTGDNNMDFMTENNTPRTIDVRTVLKEFPDKIFLLEQQKLLLDDELRDLKESIGKKRIKVDMDILSDSLNEEWKTALSNQAKRDAEAVRRLDGDAAYQVDLVKQNELINELRQLNLKIELMRDVMKNCRALAVMRGE